MAKAAKVGEANMDSPRSTLPSKISKNQEVMIEGEKIS